MRTAAGHRLPYISAAGPQRIRRTASAGQWGTAIQCEGDIDPLRCARQHSLEPPQDSTAGSNALEAMIGPSYRTILSDSGPSS